MTDLAKLFCNIHDFWIKFEPEWNAYSISQKKRAPRRQRSLCLSEVMTIVILFHLSGFRNFKTFYTGYVMTYLSKSFPLLPSYNRFVEIKKEAIFPLYCFLSPRGYSIGGTKHFFVPSERKRRHLVLLFSSLGEKGKIFFVERVMMCAQQ